MGIEDSNQYDLYSDYTNIEVFLNNLAACPMVSFEAESISLPTGTVEAQIP